MEAGTGQQQPQAPFPSLNNLDVQQSWWAMDRLGSSRAPWSAEHKLEWMAEAGFTGVLARIPEGAEAAKAWRAHLAQYRFSYGVQAFPATRAELADTLRRAGELGAAYVNAQVADAFVVGEEAVHLLQELCEESKAQGLPCYVETHRGRITQDLIRTAAYVEQVRDLRLTIDLSHYVVAGELGTSSQAAERLIERLLARTSSIHARVSNGQQIQIDISTAAGAAHLERFACWWRRGMQHWLTTARPGDRLPFVAELGPADYAIESCYGLEISDRKQQAIRLKQLAERLWREVCEQHRISMKE
ncbi:sugar phosphate isomerase/epimerase [Paenibacillus sp. IB182496]|uniref:Sugar phosphate isomerase/epimerase n=1 Tax=Paenibacillus sabuli TaxID=2772509 RepID=A0A927GQ79_9BACL|nr:TIM barrel protein [Paenibacillus sabuli]MBD2844244.1 sugar phosphate isomerase/epimerase [Paenibacillus sabuli]